MHLPVGVVGLILCSVAIYAQNPVAYATDARLVALAGTGAALKGVSATWLNPAAAVGDTDWAYGASAAQLSGVARLRVVTGQARYRNLALQLAATRFERYHAFRFGLCYARPITRALRIGAGFTLLRQDIIGHSRQLGMVGVLGGQFDITGGLRFGAYAAIPSDRSLQELRAGGGLRYLVSENVSLLLDGRYDRLWGWSLHTALRYAPSESLVLRLGYDGAGGAMSVGATYVLGVLGEADVAVRYHPLLGAGGAAGFLRRGGR